MKIAAELSRQDPERRVTLAVADGVVANGDRQLLRVALTNLLGNAWKFTGKRVDARIEFGSHLCGESAAFYFVRDNGVGFDPTYADKLFAAFQRLHSKTEFRVPESAWRPCSAWSTAMAAKSGPKAPSTTAPPSASRLT